MQFTELKNGMEVEFSHSRKGQMHGIVDELTENWLTLVTMKRVDGLVNIWLPGERIPCSIALCSNLELVAEFNPEYWKGIVLNEAARFLGDSIENIALQAAKFSDHPAFRNSEQSLKEAALSLVASIQEEAEAERNYFKSHPELNP